MENLTVVECRKCKKAYVNKYPIGVTTINCNCGESFDVLMEEKKTIEVNLKVYNKLIEIAKEMTEQDPRGTRMPHLFQVRSEEKVYHENGDIEVWIDYEYEPTTYEGSRGEVIKSYCKDKEIELPKIDLEDEYECEQWLQEETKMHQSGYSIHYKDTNAFFTAKACKEHIDANHYHYNNPVDYLNHSWRNSEMEIISEFLCNLVGKTNHK